MESEQFFGYYHAELPEHLSVRGGDAVFIIGVLITLSILLISWAVKSNHRIPTALPKLFLSALQTDQKYKEYMRINSSASILLILNFVITSFILLFLALNSKEILSAESRIYIAAILPVSLLIIQVIPTYIITFISGSAIPLPATTANTFAGYQMIGTIFIVLAVVWSLNPELSNLMILLFFILLIISQAVRFVKNSYLLLTEGISWYYLLLYLCTLEILPLFVAYYVFSTNFLS